MHDFVFTSQQRREEGDGEETEGDGGRGSQPPPPPSHQLNDEHKRKGRSDEMANVVQ
jgi:hypothetical protein